MKNLYFIEIPYHFILKVGDFPCYYDKEYNWKRLNLAVVRRRNREKQPRIW